jgi:hypothetical protein
MVLTLFFGAGCRGGGGWAGTMADSAGVQIVSNPETGVWTQPPTVEREVDIGTAEGEAVYQFGQIASIDVGSDSSVYVLDGQAHTVRVFDSSGKFVREMGRPGSGPGELGQTALSVLVGPGDTVFVADVMQPRVNRYGPDGKESGTIPLSGRGVSMKWAITSDGMLVHQTRALPNAGPDAAQAQPAANDFLFVRDRSGTLRDTLLALPAGKSVQFDGPGGMPAIRLFDSEPVWALMEDGKVMFGVNTQYSIHVYGTDGQLQRVVRRAFQQRPVTDADRQAFLKFLEEAWGRAGVPPQVLPRLLQSVGFADAYPAFANLMGGPEGSVWVQRVQSADDVAARGGEFDVQDVGAPVWDIFDAEGRYLGALELPNRFTPMRIKGDRVWGVWRDDLDVQHVVRLRVTGDWSAG